jgi:hypothetical protein
MLRSRAFEILLSIALPLAVAAAPAIAPREARADGPAAAPHAPPQRTAFNAQFQRYLLMPDGRTMGLMLRDGTFVFTPGHALHRDAPSLETGAQLDIEGAVRHTPTGNIVRGAVVRVNGNVIADARKAHRRHAHHEGHAKDHQGKHHHELQPVTGAGQIAAIVSSPQGHVHALVLTDGTTAMAHDLETLGLKVGDRVSVAGMGGAYPRGKALRIDKITLPSGQTRDIPHPVRHQPEPGQGPV